MPPSSRHWIADRVRRLSPEQRRTLARRLGLDSPADDAPRTGKLVAYATAPSNADPETLRQYLRTRLPEYMVPSSIVVLDAFPRLANGKIDIRSLPEPDSHTHDSAQAFAPPRNEAEAALLGIWSSVLGTSEISVFDDFYMIGGDSILSIQVISRAREAGFTFTPAEFFASRTIDRLASYRRTGMPATGTGRETRPDAASIGGPVPLSPIQHWFFDEHSTDPHHWGQTLDLELAWDTYGESTLGHDGGPSAAHGDSQSTQGSSRPEDRIRRALGALLDRHEALRLRFTHSNEHGRQAEVAPRGLEAPLDVLEGPKADLRRQAHGPDYPESERHHLASGPGNPDSNRHQPVDAPDHPASGFQRDPGVDGNPRSGLQNSSDEDYDLTSESALQALEGPALERGANPDFEDQIDNWVATAHSGMRLDTAPLLRALLVIHEGLPARLILAAHHLVIDAVSWSLLVEDLRRLLQSDPAAPSDGGGTPYATWTRTLGSLAAGAALEGEIGYWLEQQENGAFPVDTQRPVIPCEADIKNRTIHLDSSTSESFLGDANQAYRTRPLDLFLAAFVQAWHATTGTDTFAASLESHGRDVEPTGLDLGRTVGWLTAVYPLRLEMPADTALRSLIRETKERVRAVPNGGIGYGVLRYLARLQAFGNRKIPQLVINYLGRIDHAWARTDGLRVRGFRTRGARSPRGSHGPLVEVNGWVEQGRLHVEIGFSSLHFEQGTMDRLTAHFEESLRAVVSHCLQTDASGYTPSDFPDVQMSQDDLDALLGNLE